MRRTRATARPTAPISRLARPVKRRSTFRASALPFFAAILWLAAVASPSAEGQTFKVLYSFAGYPTDGAQPLGGLLMDAAGNLYGTTRYGGSHETCPGDGECGTVFKLDTNGVETVLHNFAGPDGANPTSNLIMDANGDLYGTTEFGGKTSICVDTEYAGCGVVFKLSGTNETVLYRFNGGADGAFPWAGVIMDAHGALYGTTNQGGATGGGVAFKLVGKKEMVLHSFCSENNCKDGTYLTSGLIMDVAGNLYGTAAYGGDVNCDYPSGCGVVFKLTGKKETVLHSFKGSPDGDNPSAALFMDPSGDLYGTTSDGGKESNGGTVFKVGQGGKERVLHTFRSAHGGSDPETSVVRDAQGNLYGTTVYNPKEGGTVFEITADGEEKVLHYFCSEKDCADGGIPNDLIIDANGNLYGTTYGGINGNGVIFMITPAPSHSD